MRKKPGHFALATMLLLGCSADLLRASEPQTPGTISVEARPVDQDLSAALPVFVEAVGKTLGDRGFTIIEGVGMPGWSPT